MNLKEVCKQTQTRLASVPMEVFAIPVLLPFVRVERLLVLAFEVALVARELLVGPVVPHVRYQLRPAPALEGILVTFFAGQQWRRVGNLGGT